MICIKGKSYTPIQWTVLANALIDANIHVKSVADCNKNCMDCAHKRICLDLDEAISYAAHMSRKEKV